MKFRKLIKPALAAFAALCFVYSEGCIHEYFPAREKVLLRGGIIPYEWAPDTVALQGRLSLLENKLKQDSSFKLKNDYAATLIRLKEFSSAISLLKNIFAAQPGESHPAFNLGAAYEFSGKPDSAAYWFNLGMKIKNDNSPVEQLHGWLLGVKQNPSHDAAWMISHPALGTDAALHKKTMKSSPAWYKVQNQIEALDQLIREQVYFVSAPSAAIACLAWQEGLLQAEENSPLNGYALFQLALAYAGTEASPLLEKITAALQKLGFTEETAPDVTGFVPPSIIELKDTVQVTEQKTVAEQTSETAGILTLILFIAGGIAALGSALYLLKSRKG